MSYFDDVSGLCQTPGPSGFEGPAAEKAARLLAPLVDELKVDRLGSVIGVRPPWAALTPEYWRIGS